MITFWIELSCDADRCSVGRNDFVAPFDISENLRGGARNLEVLRESEGWTTKHGRHYCPKHKAVQTTLRLAGLGR